MIEDRLYRNKSISIARKVLRLDIFFFKHAFPITRHSHIR